MNKSKIAFGIGKAIQIVGLLITTALGAKKGYDAYKGKSKGTKK